MKVINPFVEIWKPANPVQHVARCARVCYGKDSPIGREKADSKLIELLKDKGHLSMFRHETHYFIIPRDDIYLFKLYENAEYNKISEWIGIDIMNINSKIYVVMNGQYILDHIYSKDLKNTLQYEVSEHEFIKEPASHCMIRRTFHIITQISTSRELNRVSPNNISEKSTRYVYEDGTLCAPHFILDKSYNDEQISMYMKSCEQSFDMYKKAVDIGMTRQDARGMLPLDTATECAYTYNLSEWDRIINLRFHGTTGVPHPNAKIIAGKIKEELEKEVKLFNIKF